MASPWDASSIRGLFLLAASLLFIAVMVCGFVVRAICARIVPGRRRLMTPIVRAACLTALWIPAWVLFMETWSLLMIAAGVHLSREPGILPEAMRS